MGDVKKNITKKLNKVVSILKLEVHGLSQQDGGLDPS
jgi:hypothetical protein